MRSRIGIPMFLLVAVPVAGICWSAGGTPDGPKGQVQFDAGKPETWQPAIAEVRENLDGIVQALISVAGDEKRADKERRQAILLLGEIGTKESLAFLTENVSLRIPADSSRGDRGRLLRTPCKYALAEGDWRAAEAILDSLDKPRPRIDLIHLSYPLERILYNDVAVAVVHRQLLQKPKEARRKNLEALKKLLET